MLEVHALCFSLKSWNKLSKGSQFPLVECHAQWTVCLRCLHCLSLSFHVLQASWWALSLSVGCLLICPFLFFQFSSYVIQNGPSSFGWKTNDWVSSDLGLGSDFHRYPGSTLIKVGHGVLCISLNNFNMFSMFYALSCLQEHISAVFKLTHHMPIAPVFFILAAVFEFKDIWTFGKLLLHCTSCFVGCHLSITIKFPFMLFWNFSQLLIYQPKSKAELMVLTGRYHDSLAIILWYQDSLAIRSQPHFFGKVLLLEDAFIVTHNKKCFFILVHSNT